MKLQEFINNWKPIRYVRLSVFVKFFLQFCGNFKALKIKIFFFNPFNFWTFFSTTAITVLLVSGLTSSALATLRVSTPDFNGNGRSDIVWRHETNGENAIWLMNGRTASLATLIQREPNLNAKIVGTGDFNGDGRVAEILWRDVIRGINSIWFMNGATVSSTARLLDVTDLNWKVVGIGDFNGDGRSDIVWRHETNGENAIWLMNGRTVSLATLIQREPNLNAKIVGIGDFNGDGRVAEILWRDVVRGINTIWFMNGATVSSTARLLDVTDLNWKVVGIGDFNGDRRSDIVWRHETNGENAIWLMNGRTVSLATLIQREPNLNAKIVGIGDFNGDGKAAEILWRDVIRGINSIWFMNGATVSSTARLLDVTDLNWNVVGTGTNYRTQYPTLPENRYTDRNQTSGKSN